MNKMHGVGKQFQKKTYSFIKLGLPFINKNFNNLKLQDTSSTHNICVENSFDKGAFPIMCVCTIM